jgi:hypothetical protein
MLNTPSIKMCYLRLEVAEIYKGEEIRGVDGPAGADLPKV